MIQPNLEERLLRLENLAQRALDIQAVQNIMSTHTYLYEAGMYEEMLAQFAVKTPGVTVEIANWGVFLGFEGARKMIVGNWKLFEKLHAEGMRKTFPRQVKNDREGMLDTQALCSPVIEVAEDGQTAKGLWSGPSTQTQFGSRGLPEAAWAWIKFGVDFVKEDGKWKIWHYHLCPLFRTGFDKSWVETSIMFAEMAEKAKSSDSPPLFDFPEPDLPTTEYYNAYGLTVAPKYIPRPPEPYRTFSETFSY
jgi:hypothetical protein